MEDVLLEQFLNGDPLVVRQLRPIVLDFVNKADGKPDDAREVFQIVSLALLERSRRTPGQYVGKLFKTWLNKRRKDPRSVGERVKHLQAVLDEAFAPYPDIKSDLRNREESAAVQFKDIVRVHLSPVVTEEGGGPGDVDDIIESALEKIRHVILDFKDYFLKSCKNEWLRLKKKRGMIRPEEEMTHLSVEDDAEADIHEQKNLILNLLQKLSKACQKLLHQLYIEGKTKSEMVLLLGYENSGSFDVAKSRCLSALKKKL